jgi:hypothetical protein
MLDAVYNFDDVILRRPKSQIIMRPPVISEAELSLALGDGGPGRTGNGLRLFDYQDRRVRDRAAELAGLSRSHLG